MKEVLKKIKTFLSDCLCENIEIYECSSDYICKYAILADARSSTHIDSTIEKLYIKIKASNKGIILQDDALCKIELKSKKPLLVIDDSSSQEVLKILKNDSSKKKEVDFSDLEFEKKISKNISNDWGILDCGTFMIHLLTNEKRRFLEFDEFFKEK